jgi:hypothetical protein
MVKHRDRAIANQKKITPLVIAGGFELEVESRQLRRDDSHVSLVTVVVEVLWFETKKFDHLANPK